MNPENIYITEYTHYRCHEPREYIYYRVYSLHLVMKPENMYISEYTDYTCHHEPKGPSLFYVY